MNLPKDKKCRNCKAIFSPSQSMQVVCSPMCAIDYVKTKKEKAFKEETRLMKKARDDTDRALWIKKAQKAFNAWIRHRDAGLPCISCGCPDGKGKRNACHYRPAGINTALRFDERNVNAGCERCNTFLSGNLTGYRVGLIQKIGIDAVVDLEQNHKIRRWTIPELKAIEKDFKSRLR